MTDLAVASFMSYGPTSESFSFSSLAGLSRSFIHRLPSQAETGLGYAIWYGAEYTLFAGMPSSRAAAATIGLNVEPGW